ncbi:MAG: insulinase family protein [Burkholderiales bacterium]|nr:insulinase family protein [Burkholderiales bacterium]
MRIPFLLLGIVLGLMLTPVHADTTLPTRSRGRQAVDKMVFPPMKFKLPQVGDEVLRRVLSNGMVVWMVPDSTLPWVRARLAVRGGTLHESLPQHGLVALTSTVQRTGGTRNLSPEELHRKLELEAIELYSDFSAEFSLLELDFLSEGLETGLELLSEVARHPRFDAAQLEIAREQFHEELRRQNDTPSRITHREFPYLVFGEDPSGRKLSWPTLQTISREDLLAWHARIWTPDRAFLAVAGDFEPDALMARLESVFGDWKPNGVALPEVPSLGTEPANGVFLVERPLNQSHVVMGHMGISRHDPDLEPIEVMDYILGSGSFSSRLVERIRNRAGLAYSVSSRIGIKDPRRGSFRIAFQTRTDATHRAIDMVRTEIEELREQPVSEAELQQARASLLNSMVSWFDNPFQTVCRFMDLELQGKPYDYFQTRMDNLRAITREDVQRVARRVLQPDRLILLVVGNSEGFDASLEDLGPVQKVELQTVP